MDGENRSSTVLVTGGSGFIGSWVIVVLLRHGFQIRTTVRNLARSTTVQDMVRGQVDCDGRLDVVAADLMGDTGWDEAMSGVDYVVHVASPMPIGEYRGQDVITPAREGTRRVLEAALRAGVRRVVVTSSTAAAGEQGHGGLSDESAWTSLPDKPIYNYPRAKTLAEQDAWVFAERAGERLQLVTVLPSSVQGPVLGKDYSASVDVVGLMLRGKMPLLPRLGFNVVDVRDLAELHVLAMTSSAAAGQRFIGGGDFLWFSDIAQILRDNLGADAAKVATRSAPDLLVRFGGRFNPEMAQLAPNLGMRRDVTSAKAERMLGWRARSATQSILDTARSLIARGLV